MRLGIYIGSFNPPHLGHLKVIKTILTKNYVDKVFIIPTLNYWDKQDLAPLTDRINMLKYYENEIISVDTKYNKYCYTIDLMHALQKDYPHDTLFLILGADNLLAFDKWKNYQELLKYHIIVVNRDNLNITPYLENLGKEHFTVLDDFVNIHVSSSEIRQGKKKKYLDQQVLLYIKEHHLYEAIEEISDEKKN